MQLFISKSYLLHVDLLLLFYYYYYYYYFIIIIIIILSLWIVITFHLVNEFFPIKLCKI